MSTFFDWNFANKTGAQIILQITLLNSLRWNSRPLVQHRYRKQTGIYYWMFAQEPMERFGKLILRLKELRSRMIVYGEAIHGTTAWKVSSRVLVDGTRKKPQRLRFRKTNAGRKLKSSQKINMLRWSGLISANDRKFAWAYQSFREWTNRKTDTAG